MKLRTSLAVIIGLVIITGCNRKTQETVEPAKTQPENVQNSENIKGSSDSIQENVQSNENAPFKMTINTMNTYYILLPE